MVGLLPDRKIFGISGGSGSCPTESSAHLKMCHPETKFGAHLKVFTFAFVRVKICIDKSDRGREMGKTLLCKQELKAFSLACKVSFPFHPFAEV